MANPLNQLLYAHLVKAFRSVRVSKEGEATQIVHFPDWGGPRGRLKAEILASGEEYLVSCPFCSDTRFRLSINHRWATRDQKTGVMFLHLAHCYNEDCLNTPERRRALHAKVFPGGRYAGEAEAIIKPVSTEPPAPPPPIQLPSITRLDRLPPTHPANVYLAGRFFDPEMLGRCYGLGYCEDSHYYLAHHRVIIPVWQDKKLVGWQARYIGDMNWHDDKAPPKYWTSPGMQRGKVLYNLDQARQYRTVVVVEGPADVWSMGAMAVGTFGFPMTRDQMNLLAQTCANSSVILLFDPDVLEKPRTAKQYAQILEELVKGHLFAGGVAAVRLPKGKDPGSMAREMLRNYVAKDAAKQGVEVSWSKHEV